MHTTEQPRVVMGNVNAHLIVKHTGNKSMIYNTAERFYLVLNFISLKLGPPNLGK